MVLGWGLRGKNQTHIPLLEWKCTKKATHQKHGLGRGGGKILSFEKPEQAHLEIIIRLWQAFC